jgi:6-pyruvoyl-tetrahydropterin synthase
MKYQITVVIDPVCYAHKLNLPYGSPCNRIHGHNARVEVVLSGDELDSNGMLIDFSQIKKLVKDAYDHKWLGSWAMLPGETLPPAVAEEMGFLTSGPSLLVEPSTSENFATAIFRLVFGYLENLPSDEPYVQIVAVRVKETGSTEVLVTREG